MRPDWPGNRYNVIKWCVCNVLGGLTWRDHTTLPPRSCKQQLQLIFRSVLCDRFPFSPRGCVSVHVYWSTLAFCTASSLAALLADALLISLCGKRIPGWLNRLSYLGSLVPCLLPRGVADGPAPVDSAAASDSAPSGSTSFYSVPGRLSTATQRRSPTAAARSTSGGGFSSIAPAVGAAAGTGHTLGSGSSTGRTTSTALGVRPDREAMAQAALRRSEMQKAAASAVAANPAA